VEIRRFAGDDFGTSARPIVLSSAKSTSPACVQGKGALLYGMRCIAAFAGVTLTAIMSEKHSSPNGSTRPNRSNPRGSTPANQQHLQGVARLVNPLKNDPEVVASEEEPGERDYVGRLLNVADEALHSVKRGGEHRKRRRVH
jgi:hypothetical protein